MQLVYGMQRQVAYPWEPRRAPACAINGKADPWIIKLVTDVLFKLQTNIKDSKSAGAA